MFRSLFNAQKIQLTKQCRADADYANASCDYHDTNNFDLVRNYFGQVRKIKIDKEWRPSEEDTSIHVNITRTNNMRKLINHYWMEANKPETFVPLSGGKEFKYIYVGLPIIAKETRKKLDYYNNEMFIVDQITDSQVRLTDRSLGPKKKNKSITVPLSHIATDFNPGYAITTYGAEGLTINHPHAIWEFSIMSNKTRYTAMTRTTDAKLLTINWGRCKVAYEDLFGTETELKKARIYKLSDDIKTYIGSTTQSLEQRFEEHLHSSKTGQTKLYKYMREHKLYIELVEEFYYSTYEDILQRERSYIETYDTVKNGLNMRDAIISC